MRYFELLNFRHFMLYLFPGLVTVVLFAIGLSFKHFWSKDAEQRKTGTHYTFTGGIEERNAPFPLVLTLTIAGTVIWAILYILFYGLLEVKL